jgi:peptidyl-prolyl cis-trans isomerase B (cyclophilin B)
MCKRAFTAGAVALALLSLAGLPACTRREPEAAAPAPAESLIAAGPHDVAVVRVEDLGDIRIELLPELAPKTVQSFEQLADQGFFDGTTFHRVIPGFMIQGGDPLTRNQDPRDDGKGGPGYRLPDEFNALHHARGVVSMANKGHTNTAGSQFFIVQEETPQLDGHYTAFGRVIDGMDVVDAITKLEIDKYGRYGPRNRPYPKDARVTSIRIERAAAAPAAAPAPAAATARGGAVAPPGA